MSAFFELRKATTDRNERKWRKEQLRKLWLVIRMTFAEETGIRKRWRMRKCYKIFKKRLWHLSGCDWVAFIAGLSDWQTVGEVKNPQIMRDLYAVRNKAIYACHLWNLRLI